jgi:hypothetical protein
MQRQQLERLIGSRIRFAPNNIQGIDHMETSLRRILIVAMLGAVVSCILMRPTAAADNDAPAITFHDKSSTRLYVRTRFPVKVDFPIRKVKLYLDSPRVPGWNEIDAVGLIDQQATTHWAAKAEASSTFASRPRHERLRQATPIAKEATIPDDAILVGRVAETSNDKRSLGGNGEAVRFERPDRADAVVVVSLYASRYGLPQPPEEDFHLYLLDAEQQVIKDMTFPYNRKQPQPSHSRRPVS